MMGRKIGSTSGVLTGKTAGNSRPKCCYGNAEDPNFTPILSKQAELANVEESVCSATRSQFDPVLLLAVAPDWRENQITLESPVGRLLCSATGELFSSPDDNHQLFVAHIF